MSFLSQYLSRVEQRKGFDLFVTYLWLTVTAEVPRYVLSAMAGRDSCTFIYMYFCLNILLTVTLTSHSFGTFVH